MMKGEEIVSGACLSCILKGGEGRNQAAPGAGVIFRRGKRWRVIMLRIRITVPVTSYEVHHCVVEECICRVSIRDPVSTLRQFRIQTAVRRFLICVDSGSSFDALRRFRICADDF